MCVPVSVANAVNNVYLWLYLESILAQFIGKTRHNNNTIERQIIILEHNPFIIQSYNKNIE